MTNNKLQFIPQISVILENPNIKNKIKILSQPVVSSLIKDQVNKLKTELKKFKNYDEKQIINNLLERIIKLLNELSKQKLQKIINATGIILHTNMGRSPLDEEIFTQIKDIVTSYSNLELNLLNGKRGNRNGLIPELIKQFTGAENCCLVNNNAAAVFLMLNTLTKGKEVIISRAEQVQIGGGFRIPEILTISGAKIIEVGTTNITTEKDYLDAITENTAMILIVHSSNFKIRGFTKSINLTKLKQQLPSKIILAIDQGSGCPTTNYIKGEKGILDYIKQGADLVCFSGDKILGMMQSGFLIGQDDLISQIKTNQLYRTYRIDKTRYAYIEKALIKHLNQQEDLINKINLKLEQIIEKTNNLLIKYDWLKLINSNFSVGGGSSPDEYYPSKALMINLPESNKILKNLRSQEIPIIGYIKNKSVILDLSTINLNEIDFLDKALATIKY